MKLNAAGLLLALSLPISAQTVRFSTNLGNIDVNLLPDSAPGTVANFLKYANRKSYDSSFIHRSVRSFIVQGGGYRYVNGSVVQIPSDGAIKNEYKLSNARGTIAMAKLGSDPNSATTQWFFNLSDNSSNLNNQNGGFTVFGRVADSSSMSVVDRIAGLAIYNAGSPFDQLPLQNYNGSQVTASNLVMINSITVLEPKPVISQNGVISAGNFGGFDAAAVGSFLEIYGSNLAGTTRNWSSTDFNGRQAPTSLDGVTVTVGGNLAFVSYVSPGQVNVQVPSGISTGTAVPVVVTHNGQASAAGQIVIRNISPGLLAPANFLVDGKQYAAAYHSSNGSLVSDGSLPNVPAAPAKPGETITFYGTGFGATTAGEVVGQIANGLTQLATPVEFHFADIPAEVSYAGLAPELVGVYQFNVVVPVSAPSGDVSLRVLSGGTPVAQTLVVPIQPPAN